MAAKQRISIRLTPEQQEELKQVTGRQGSAIELDVEELEERIAPSTFSSSLDTSLADPRPHPFIGGWVTLK